jgi:hypothetical protein
VTFLGAVYLCFALFFCFNFPFQNSLVRGARTPRLAHSAPPRVEDSLCCGGLPGGGYRIVSFVFPGPHIPWGSMALSREQNKKIKKSAPRPSNHRLRLGASAEAESLHSIKRWMEMENPTSAPAILEAKSNGYPALAKLKAAADIC